MAVDTLKRFRVVQEATRQKRVNLLLGLLVVVYVLIVLRNAWICDDAYITFRTVDNFVNGFGLRWNVAERVQTFTHPLWMFIFSVFYFFTHEAYFTALVMSIVFSTMAVIYYLRRFPATPVMAALGLLTLILSKGFVDFSTSGLENPLSFLLIGIVLFLYFKKDVSYWNFFLLTLAASALLLNRLDYALLVAPLILHWFWRLHGKKALRVALVGFSPLLLWEIFSVLYYGFPFPNTAYAKLATGIPLTARAVQGLFYLFVTLHYDPLLLFVMLGGVLVALTSRNRRNAIVGIGICLYLLYIVLIGGDFMFGRFLTIPFLCAVILLTRLPLIQDHMQLIIALVVVVLLGAAAHPSPVFGQLDVTPREKNLEVLNGIIDERRGYFLETGLMNYTKGTAMPNHVWAEYGRNASFEKLPVTTRMPIGFYGYFAGPQTYIIDQLGLGDPLLARIKPVVITDWRPGHLERLVPRGYRESIESDTNKIVQPKLAVFYDKIKLVTRGSIWSWPRFKQIIKLNLGLYNYLLDDYNKSHETTVTIDDLSEIKAAGTAWSDPDNTVITGGDLTVELNGRSHAPGLEISLDHNDTYRIDYLDGDDVVANQELAPAYTDIGGLAIHRVAVPPEAVEAGYTKLRITPVGGDDMYSVGHIRLLETKPD
jgi:arabinofuranosyltransferase